MPHSTSHVAALSCAAILCIVGPLASFAQSTKPPEVKTIGPAVALGDAQRQAIEAKQMQRAASGAPRAAEAKPTAPAGPLESTVLPAEPTRESAEALRAMVAAKNVRWKSVSPALGKIPRPEWRSPWEPRKLPDVTISRPLPLSPAPTLAPTTAAPAKGGRP